MGMKVSFSSLPLALLKLLWVIGGSARSRSSMWRTSPCAGLLTGQGETAMCRGICSFKTSCACPPLAFLCSPLPHSAMNFPSLCSGQVAGAGLPKRHRFHRSWQILLCPPLHSQRSQRLLCRNVWDQMEGEEHDSVEASIGEQGCASSSFLSFSISAG